MYGSFYEFPMLEVMYEKNKKKGKETPIDLRVTPKKKKVTHFLNVGVVRKLVRSKTPKFGFISVLLAH